MAPTSAAKRTLLALVLGGGAGIGLFTTNPGPAEFEGFAADQLTRVLTEELCKEDGLPMMARLVIQDCPGLVASQHGVLGRLAGVHTRRRNLGLLSLYSTEMGGQKILLDWRLPRYSALTLAAAGKFVLLRASESSPSELVKERSGDRP